MVVIRLLLILRILTWDDVKTNGGIDVNKLFFKFTTHRIGRDADGVLDMMLLLAWN